jgi:WD40 repeat protein
LDQYGDPLPQNAICRIGSLQLRCCNDNDVQCTPDGSKIVAVGKDRQITIWETATGKRLLSQRLEGSERLDDSALRISRNGRFAAAFGDDQPYLYVWDVESGNKLAQLSRQIGEHLFWISSDGRTVAVESMNSVMSLWDWRTRTKRQLPIQGERPGHGGTFHWLRFSPDGKLLATYGNVDPVAIWDVAANQKRLRLDCLGSGVDFSRDGTRLATISRDLKRPEAVEVSVWNLATGQRIARFSKPFELTHVEFAPDGKLIACSGGGNTILWDLSTGKEIPTAHPPDYGAFFVRSDLLASSNGCLVRLWDLTSGRELHHRSGLRYQPSHAAFSSNGRFIALKDPAENSVSLWDATTGRLLRNFGLKQEDRNVIRLDFSPSSESFLVYAASGKAFSVPVQSDKVINTAPDKPLNEPVVWSGSLADGHAGSLTLKGTREGRVRRFRMICWDSATAKIRWQKDYGADCMGSPAVVSPDGRLVVLPTGTGRGAFDAPDVVNLEIRDVSTGALAMDLNGPYGAPIAFSRDGRLLAVGKFKRHTQETFDGGSKSWRETESVHVFETLSGKELAEFSAKPGELRTFLGNGRWILQSHPAHFAIMDATLGKELGRWPKDPSERTLAAISSDERRFATAQSDATVLVWDLESMTKSISARPRVLSESDYPAIWKKLASEKPSIAYRSLWAMVDNPALSVSWISRELPSANDDIRKVQSMIADLDNDNFQRRRRASQDLGDLRFLAEAPLRQALNGNISTEAKRRVEEILAAPSTIVSPVLLQSLRGIQVLEYIANDEAVKVLRTLSHGAAGHPLTKQAAAALERLGKRS